jgi:hypothetical protein
VRVNLSGIRSQHRHLVYGLNSRSFPRCCPYGDCLLRPAKNNITGSIFRCQYQIKKYSLLTFERRSFIILSMSQTLSLDATDAGCWFNGANGDPSIRVIDLAVSLGMVLDRDELSAVESFRHDIEDFRNAAGDLLSVADWVCNQGGITDASVEWLNDNIAPEGFLFEFFDGDFFFSALDNDDEGE